MYSRSKMSKKVEDKCFSDDSSEEFFHIDMLTCPIYDKSQQKESGYCSSKENKKTAIQITQISGQYSNFLPYIEAKRNNNIVKDYEEKIKKVEHLYEAKKFITNPSEDNIFYPDVNYYKEKLQENNEMDDVRSFIRKSLKNELEISDREKISDKVNTPISSTTKFKIQATLKKVISPEKIQLRRSPNIFDEVTEGDKSLANHNVSVDIFSDEDEHIEAISNKSKQATTSKMDDDQLANIVVEAEDINMERRAELVNKIEELISRLLESLVKKQPIEFQIRDTSKWYNCDFKGDILTLKPKKKAKCRKVSLYNIKSEHRFAIIMYILAEVYNLLVTKTSCTLRELYYRDPELIENQTNINNGVNDICCLLDAAPWELGVLSSSKGLIAGPLIITLADNEIVDCSSAAGGIILPHDTTGIKSLQSTAELVLIVEKDTVYEKLLKQDILTIMGKNIILITGKGFPDINTRIIINKIWKLCKIPIYALVDADPFGIEILFVYKYGSRAKSYMSNSLACPEIRWIGIHPSEMDLLSIPSINFGAEDEKKLKDILSRDYYSQEIRNELLIFEKFKKKAEIEAISSFAINYLITEYIPNKLKRNLVI